MRRLIRRTGLLLVLLGCAGGPAPAAEEDAPPGIEERSAGLCRRALAHGSAALLASTASLRLPHRVLSETLLELGLQPDESVVILSGEGDLLFSCVPGQVTAGSPRRAVWRQVVHLPEGAAVYHDLGEDGSYVVRRAAAWAPITADPGGEVLMAECSEPMDRSAESPLTGRWQGAYSQTTRASREAGGRGEETRSAGQLSVLVVQNADRLRLRCASSDWQVDVEGLVTEGRFAAGGGLQAPDGGLEETWFAEGVYDPGRDTIKGTITGVGRDRVTRRAFFLKPEVPLEE